MNTSRTRRPVSVEANSLVICGRCRRLKGEFPEFHPDAVLGCACAPREVRRADPPVGGADHTTYAELCRSCGLVLLPSGSKYSVWFCEECLPLVTALNRAVRCATVPIGRHSSMANVVPACPSARNLPVVEACTEANVGLFDRIGQLGEYARTVVDLNLRELEFPDGTDVAVRDYLAAVDDSNLSCVDGFFVLVFQFALVEPAAA